MSDESEVLNAFLRTDPDDVGCDEAMRLLHVYVELVSSGKPGLPGVAAHLAACGPCSDDFAGLLAAVHTPA